MERFVRGNESQNCDIENIIHPELESSVLHDMDLEKKLLFNYDMISEDETTCKPTEFHPSEQQVEEINQSDRQVCSYAAHMRRAMGVEKVVLRSIDSGHESRMRRAIRVEKAIVRSIDKLDRVWRIRGLPVDKTTLHETAVDNTFDLKDLNAALPSVSEKKACDEEFRTKMLHKLNGMTHAYGQYFGRPPVMLSSYTSDLVRPLGLDSPALSTFNELPPFSDYISQRNTKNIKCASFQPLLNRPRRISFMRNVPKETMDEAEKDMWASRYLRYLNSKVQKRDEPTLSKKMLDDEAAFSGKLKEKSAERIELTDSDIQQSQIKVFPLRLPSWYLEKNCITNFQSSSENEEVKLGEPFPQQVNLVTEDGCIRFPEVHEQRRLDMTNSQREGLSEEIGAAVCESSFAEPSVSIGLIHGNVSLM